MALYNTGFMGGAVSGTGSTGQIQHTGQKDIWGRYTYQPVSAAPAPARSTGPATPSSAPSPTITAYNQPQVYQEIGKTAASLADPFAEQRPQYQQQLSNLMRNPGEFASSPVYKFAFEQGREAVNRTAGARGQLGSGNRLLDLTKFGQGLAGQQFYQLAPMLGRFAGADTSSPASAGLSYARGATGGIEAFNQQEMERAYADAIRRAGTTSGAPTGGGGIVGAQDLPPPPAPFSYDPAALAYQQQAADAPAAYAGYGSGGYGGGYDYTQPIGETYNPAIQDYEGYDTSYQPSVGGYTGQDYEGYDTSYQPSVYGGQDYEGYDTSYQSSPFGMINPTPYYPYTGTETFGEWDPLLLGIRG